MWVATQRSLFLRFWGRAEVFLTGEMSEFLKRPSALWMREIE